MPLTGSEGVLIAALQPEIKAQIEAIFTIEDVAFSGSALDRFATALATAIANKVIPHVINNSVVKTSVVGVQSGVTTLNNQLGVIT